MLSLEEVAKGRTIAEAQGMTAELGNAIARLAAGELEAGRLDTARAILEGLAVTNPRDTAALLNFYKSTEVSGEFARLRGGK